MRTGQYDRAITLEESTAGATGPGGAGAVAWTARASVWARIEPLAGREAVIAGGQQGATMAVRITVPWSPVCDAVVESWRLRSGDRVYSIISIANKSMQNEEVEFMCESGVKEA